MYTMRLPLKTYVHLSIKTLSFYIFIMKMFTHIHIFKNSIVNHYVPFA